MDRRLWGVAAVVAGLFAAAWIYMDLQKREWERTEQNIHDVIATTDSLVHPQKKDTPVQRERERVKNVVEEMRMLAGEQTQRTDSVKKVIEEEHLLDSESPQKK